MEKFTVVEGVAAPLKMINVDTDAIIPKQYLKTIKRTGLGMGMFSEKRYRDDGSENPDFVLNKPAYRNAKILVAGDNFGCGSSREHAPWALQDFGISCVISTSFGDIFYNNCFKNGVLPIQVSPEDLEKLFDDAERGANARLTIDLEKQEIRGPDGGLIKFDIDPHRKHCMLNGLDDIGLTLVKKDKLASFEEQGQGRHAALGVTGQEGGVFRFGARRRFRRPHRRDGIGRLRDSPHRPMACGSLSPPGAIKPTGTWDLAARGRKHFVFTIAGMRGIDPKTDTLVPGDEARIRQAFLNMKLIAESEGATLRDCVRIVVYVTDMFRFRPIANKVQEELWGKGPYPPRTIVEVHRLNQDDIFEVEGTFYAPQRKGN